MIVHLHVYFRVCLCKNYQDQYYNKVSTLLVIMSLHVRVRVCVCLVTNNIVHMCVRVFVVLCVCVVCMACTYPCRISHMCTPHPTTLNFVRVPQVFAFVPLEAIILAS